MNTKKMTRQEEYELYANPDNHRSIVCVGEVTDALEHLGGDPPRNQCADARQDLLVHRAIIAIGGGRLLTGSAAAMPAATPRTLTGHRESRGGVSGKTLPS